MAEQIKNINFNINTRKKFTIDGNTNKIIELDTTDINIVNRYKESVNMMEELKEDYNKINKISNIANDNNGENITLEDVEEFSTALNSAENNMRKIVNYIFDSDICDTILDKSSIFSPVGNGKLKYEQILDVLSNLYAESIKSEMDKINKKHIQKYTNKYVGVK